MHLFRRVLQAVEEIMADSDDAIICDTLLKAKTIFEALNQVLTTSLLKQNQGSIQARRVPWLLNKRKITALRDELKEIRENLSVSLSTYLMSELPVSQGDDYND
jgi:hypothetical protein